MTSARKPDDIESGAILNIDKPIGWSSNDVIRFVKNRVVGKVGHAGTLDPFATGVLLVCVGKATKQVPMLMPLEKEYRAVLQLGVETDTLDISGSTMNKADVPLLTEERVSAIIPQFLGDIEQAPPVFSALRVNGKRAYQLAREGKDVSLERRRVIIHALNILNIGASHLEFIVRCSKGTYIRSLARDMALALGTVGYLRTLCRTRIGDYTINEAEHLVQLERRLERFTVEDIQKRDRRNTI